MKRHFELRLQDIFEMPVLSLDYLEIDVQSIKGKSVALNGFFPELIERLLKRKEIKIFFLNKNYVNLAKEYWPESSSRFDLAKAKPRSVPMQTAQSRAEGKKLFKIGVYEGHVNFFSGIDLSAYLLRSLWEQGAIEKVYFIIHPETRLYPPVRFTQDFDQHLHAGGDSWEEFYQKCISWLPLENILSPGQAERLSFSDALFVNASVSYHQPVWENTLSYLFDGASGFFSDRNSHPDIVANLDIQKFSSEILLNYSPFEQESIFSLAIKERLKKQLGDFIHVKLD